MATLKDHQQATVDLLASGSGIPASASRLAHAMHDVLVVIATSSVAQYVENEKLRIKQLNDATTPGLNDKALAGDLETCRPKATPAERRVKELENTVKQLRASNAKLRGERDMLHGRLLAHEHPTEPEPPKCACLPEYYETCDVCGPPEQAGCHKDDTQCAHLWGECGGTLICKNCGEKL